ncbi:neutrophil gelatinase-associated lipocalin-like [Erethizon dorsatum]
MTLHLQCVFLILLGALQIKAQDASPRPSLLKVPLQPDFQDDLFQGKWYVLGVADNTIQNGNESHLTMYSVNYELKEDHSFNVNTTMLREDGDNAFIPARSEMTLTIYTAGKRGILSYIMRVAATDYNQFAMVYVEKNARFEWYFRSTLYGRTKELSLELKEHFVNFTTSVGFTKDNIAFSVPIGNDQLGRTEGDVPPMPPPLLPVITAQGASSLHISNNACEEAGRHFYSAVMPIHHPKAPPPMKPHYYAK